MGEAHIVLYLDTTDTMVLFQDILHPASVFGGGGGRVISKVISKGLSIPRQESAKKKMKKLVAMVMGSGMVPVCTDNQ